MHPEEGSSDDIEVAGERSACVGTVCKWLRSGLMTAENLNRLESPPGMKLEESMQSAWLEVMIEAKQCWVLWYDKNRNFVGTRVRPTHVRIRIVGLC